MSDKTLYSVKKDGLVKTGGIYVKDAAELSYGINPNISFHELAESKTREIFPEFKLEKDKSSNTAIDLVGGFEDVIFFIEVERDNATIKWIDKSSFPYPLINVPVEKQRYFLVNPKTTFYLKYNRELETALILFGEDIINNSRKEDLSANHSGDITNRTFIRVKKELAQFSDMDTQGILEIRNWIINKLIK